MTALQIQCLLGLMAETTLVIKFAHLHIVYNCGLCDISTHSDTQSCYMSIPIYVLDYLTWWKYEKSLLKGALFVHRSLTVTLTMDASKWG